MSTSSASALDKSLVEFLRFETLPPLLIGGVRKNQLRDPSTDIPQIWQQFSQHFNAIQPRVSDTAFGVCMQAEGDNSCFDYLAGCEISDDTHLASALSSVSIPAQRFAVFAHHRHVSEISAAMHAIFSMWLPKAAIEAVNAGENAVSFFERYGKDFDPKTGRGDIEIWIAVAG
ncbi:MAG: hypothetical protein JWM78_2256 [Verrucomicrobiaceae bacterium]|nr:hypothetical protein [Verrucomicrobiaceae bacterium]